MTTDEMVSVLLDVVDANIEAAPDDLAESEFGDWLEREGWPVYHVHDGQWVSVYAGSVFQFRCTKAQYREVMQRVSADLEGP